ncbi:ANKRD11 [Symbiodinium necroappetens]|uniref:ANKRD11 protein n=1 Tax=Symbiodinium necroappetens TaxID=1628268 RepID=A0A812YZG4_9DINO|nr:ANKRD11 [Symbiodinium necroappetens]
MVGDKPKHPILESGCTELMQAAYKGDTKKVKALVDGGADVNQQDAYGWTAVRYAVRNRQLKSTETLLDLGADVNIASKTGRTPLMSAAGNGLEELCKMLVEQGDADIMAGAPAADEGGKTAYDLALRTGPLGSDLIRDLVAGLSRRFRPSDVLEILAAADLALLPVTCTCSKTETVFNSNDSNRQHHHCHHHHHHHRHHHHRHRPPAPATATRTVTATTPTAMLRRRRRRLDYDHEHCRPCQSYRESRKSRDKKKRRRAREEPTWAPELLFWSLAAGGQTPGAGEEGWKRNPGPAGGKKCNPVEEIRLSQNQPLLLSSSLATRCLSSFVRSTHESLAF